MISSEVTEIGLNKENPVHTKPWGIAYNVDCGDLASSGKVAAVHLCSMLGMFTTSIHRHPTHNTAVTVCAGNGAYDTWSDECMETRQLAQGDVVRVERNELHRFRAHRGGMTLQEIYFGEGPVTIERFECGDAEKTGS